ncbi:GNAT family N-acetyltransferase [Leifsonia sp. NPDC056665]|uniref:GNAT family N-acetyltransferase n=1 Tax=Leifsonia sp. NPDC056665 TaxID=3345901 RepID=UPI003699C669
MTDEVVTESVDASTWGELQTVFGTKGDPAGCWCQWFKLSRSDWDAATREETRALLHEQVEAGSPGVIARIDGEPVGWAAVEPFSAYPALGRSPITRRREGDPEDVWAVTCFVVRLEYRKRGVARALLAGALEHARRHGATVVEGYPVDPEARPSLTAAERYHGTVSLFRDGGFDLIRRPSATRAIMRTTLTVER